MADNPFFRNPLDVATDEIRGQRFELPDLSQISTRQEDPSEREPSRRQPSGNFLPPEPLTPIFTQAAQEYGVPVDVLMALAQQESSYRTEAIGVPTKWGRAKGIMQYIDPTAESLGINPFDPAQAISAAALQFRERIDNGYSVEEAIMAHHGGDDRRQWGPKTRQYARDVLGKSRTVADQFRPLYQQSIQTQQPQLDQGAVQAAIEAGTAQPEQTQQQPQQRAGQQPDNAIDGMTGADQKNVEGNTRTPIDVIRDMGTSIQEFATSGQERPSSGILGTEAGQLTQQAQQAADNPQPMREPTQQDRDEIDGMTGAAERVRTDLEPLSETQKQERLNELNTRFESLQPPSPETQERIKTAAQQIEQEASALEAQRESVSSQSDVLAFNRRLRELNERIEQHRREVDQYNESIQRYETEADRIRGEYQNVLDAPAPEPGETSILGWAENLAKSGASGTLTAVGASIEGAGIMAEQASRVEANRQVDDAAKRIETTRQRMAETLRNMEGRSEEEIARAMKPWATELTKRETEFHREITQWAEREPNAAAEWMRGLGVDVNELAKELQADPEYQGIATDISSGIGSMLTYLGPGFLTTLMTRGAPAATRAAAGIIGASTLAGPAGASEAYNRAIKYGLPEEEALEVAMRGIPAGVVQVAPVAVILKRIPAQLQGKAAGQLRALLETFGAEFIAEGAGAVMQNLVEQSYNEEKGTWDDSLYQAAIGGSSAALIQLGIQVATRGRGAFAGPRQQEADKYIDDYEFAVSADEIAAKLLDPDRAQLMLRRPEEVSPDLTLNGQISQPTGAAPEGPVDRAVQEAAAQQAVENVAGERVSVATRAGTIAGTVESYTEDGQGGYRAQILSDDGMMYVFTDQDGVTLVRDGGTGASLSQPAANSNETDYSSRVAQRISYLDQALTEEDIQDLVDAEFQDAGGENTQEREAFFDAVRQRLEDINAQAASEYAESGTPIEEAPQTEQAAEQQNVDSAQSGGLTALPYGGKQWNQETGQAEDMSGQAEIVDYSGRRVVMKNVNGVMVPFYQSTGAGGKAETSAGKWYPFTGIGKDGWLNKLGGKDLADYYGSPALRRAAEELDATLGDIRNRTDIPKTGMTGAGEAFVNAINNAFPGQQATENNLNDSRSRVEGSIAALKRAVDSEASAQSSQPTEQPAGEPEAAQVETTQEPIVEHVTKKGKTLRGVLRDIPLDKAKEIDPYAFRKDGKSFIRADRLSDEQRGDTVSAQSQQAGESEATSKSTPDLVMKSDGSPFASEAVAKRAAKNRRLKDHVPVEVDGGWALSAQPAPSDSQRKSVKLTPASPRDFDLHGWRKPRRGEGQVYSIEKNGESIGFADVSFFPNGEARIEDIVSDEGSGSIGTADVRALLRELRRIRPEINKISGERVSGIRRGGRHGFAGSGEEVSVQLRNSPAESQRKSEQPQAEQEAATKRPRIGDPDYSLIDAMNDLMEMRAEVDAQGMVADARLMDRVRRQEQLVREMEAERQAVQQPGNDVDSWQAQAEEALSRVPSNHPMRRKWAASVRNGLRSAGDRESVLSAMREAAETDISDTSTSGRNGDKEIGTNSEGNTLYQDKNGVRYYLETSGQTQFKVSESVRVTPNGTEVNTSKRAGSEFETQEEIAARNEQQPEAKPKASQNTIFTEDAAEKARAVLRAKLGQINSGIDPEIMQAGITLAGYHIEKGARTFAAYAKAMVDDMGDNVRPYLKSWYMGVKYDPRAAGFDGMSSAAEVEAADIDTIAREEATNDTQGTAPDANTGDEGSSAESVQAPAEQQDAGNDAGQPAGGVRRNQGRAQERGSQSDADAGQPGVQGRPDGRDTTSDAGVRNGRGDSAQSSGRTDRRPGDYRIQPGELKRTGSWRNTAEQNVEIVELVKRLDEEGRPATRDEQAKLAKFTGWGASEIANGIFPDANGRYKDDRWKALGERLKAAMTDEEYAQARRTTQYAHYTSEGVIRSIYDGLTRMGFAGGSVLEPGMGVGSFRGLMPSQVMSNSQYTGVEYDTFTGKIAKHLYPDSNVIIGDFTRTKLPKEFFDAAIGNPPFSRTKVTADPEYRKHSFMLHDYFFAKTIDRVKPGGLVTFVTSKGTMDKGNARARQYLAERANLVGAIRLPQTAFKDNAGTEVVTDVLFFQKRGPGVPENDVAWLGTKEISTPQGTATINEYFADHPEMVLGEHAMTGSMYRANEYTVTPRQGVDIEQAFAEAIKNLPEDVYRPQRGSREEKAAVVDRDFNPKHQKEGGVYLGDDGTLRIIENGSGVALESRTGSNGKDIPLNPKQKEWLKGYVGVRDALKQTQLDQLTNGNWEASLKALNDAYDAFTKKHGKILAHTVSEKENADGSISVTRRFKNNPLLDIDVESPLVYAIEDIKPDGSIVKAPSMLGRTLQKDPEPQIKTTQDALFVSLNQIGSLNVDDVARLAGISRDEVISELGDLIYNDPSTGWTMADEYLSGDVVKKLREAEAAARVDRNMRRNVEALKAVQPRQLAPADITVQLGSHWVPASDVQNFAAEILSERIDVNYSPQAAAWSAEGGRRMAGEWSTSARSTGEILDGVLNNRQLKVTYRDSEGKTHTDTEATEAVNNIAKKMRDAFRRWIWQDTARTERLVSYYNENFNNIVPRQFDGSHLTLPGVSTRFDLYPHQKRAIWRAIQEGNTYFAHSVGAGKTFTMIAAGMEERRLGLSRKPAYVVPNHMLAQFSKEFLELYPTANIMVADEKNFHTRNRQRFVAQAALNDPDAIIITHSAFGMIGMSDEFSNDFIQKQVDEMRAILDEVDKSDRLTRKQIEQRIEQLENRLVSKQRGEKKDKVLTFEELGVDRLFVDEAHEFRKLDFATNRGNIKGIDSTGSQKALDLFMKTQYLEQKNPGRSLVMASGTPVTNTMGELYTVQRFFQQDQLEADGLSRFDAWSNHFGEVVEGFEQNAAGGYQVVSRFAKFVNVADLMSRVRSFMDVLTSEQLGDLVQRPSVEGGQREVVVTPVPDGYKAYQKELESRIKQIQSRSGPPAPGDDIILNVIADGRFSAIDMRFVDPTLPSDPNSKLNRLLDDVIAAYHDTAENEYRTGSSKDPVPGSSLMVFTDLGLGEASAKNRGFDMKAWMRKRLIDGGVSPSHIAFMRDNKQHAKKERLFSDMRQGKKRILIGGKDMETGVNVQKRLSHLFHLDAPWFPAAVEQREGRIIRQGNQNQSVNVKAYATKGSYDSTMWGMLSRKARFIEQAMSGDANMRSMDDVSEASSFEMASALASGDERYLKLAGLKSDVERLNRLYSAHRTEQRQLANDERWVKSSLDNNRKIVGEIETAINSRQEIRAGEFEGKVGSQTFDKREDFSNAIFDAFKAKAEANTEGDAVLGKLGGFDVVYSGLKLKGSGDFSASLDMRLPGDNESLAVYPIDPGMSISGIATRAVNQVNRLDRDLADRRDQVEQLERRLEKIESRKGAPFAEMQELTDKQEELTELELELASEQSTMDEAQDEAAQQESSTVIADSASLGGRGLTTDEMDARLREGSTGEVMGRLLDNGKIVLHDTVRNALPGAPAGTAAFVDTRGRVHLIGRNISPQTMESTIIHEMFHSAVRPLIGTEQWNSLQRDLGRLYRQYERSSGKARDFFDMAKRRIDYAQSVGDTMNEARKIEEFGAYAIEEYANAPASIKKWVDNMLGHVKAWLRRAFGIQAGQITPAQLRSLTLAAMRNGELAPSPSLGTAMNVTGPTDTPEFRRWFGDSKVVDENGEPLVVYHGTKADIASFDASQGGVSTGAQSARMGFFFTPDRSLAAEYSRKAAPPQINAATKRKREALLADDDASFMEAMTEIQEYYSSISDDPNFAYAGSSVMPSYLSIKNPLEVDYKGDSYRDTAYAEHIGRAISEGRDGLIIRNTFDPATPDYNALTDIYVAFKPEQIKSAIGNRGTFDTENPDITMSVRMPESERKAAERRSVAQATKAIRQPDDNPNDFDGGVIRDLGRVANWVQHPYTIASLNPEFTPVFRTGMRQAQFRDEIIAEMFPDFQNYHSLPAAKRANVNKVLEIGRLTGMSFTEQSLKDGIINPGFKTVVAYDENGDIVRRKEPIHAALTKPNEEVKLTAEERTAYIGLRQMFDGALDRFRDQTLIDFNLSEFVGLSDPVSAIMDSISDDMSVKQQERLQNIAQTIQEIEQAKRTGYVPLSRYGRYAITVKEDRANIEYVKNPEGGWIARGVPDDMDAFMEEIGATWNDLEGGWQVDGAQRQALRRENSRTVYSEKVEVTDLRDRMIQWRAEKTGAPATRIPAVRAARDRIKQEWVGDHANRRISVFDTQRKQDKAKVSLTELDSLAELTQLDNETWGAVREQFSKAMQGRGFRKHFFHSDNVPGYTIDFERAIGDYIASMAGHLSRRHHERDWQDAISNIKGRRMGRYAEEYKDYVNNPQEEYAMLRQTGFLYYIAGNVSTAALNATQVPIMTMPILTQASNSAIASMEVTRAYKDALRMTSFVDKGLDMFDPADAPADVRDEVQAAWDEGMFAPQFTHEVMGFTGRSDTGLKAGYEKTINYVASSYTYIERLNRLVTYIAAVRTAKRKGTKANAERAFKGNALARHTLLGDNWSPKAFGEFIVDESQFLMGKQNRSKMLRSHGSAIFQFMSFVMNSLQAWYRWASLHGRDGKMGVAASIAAIVALSGVWGAPGLDHLREMYERFYAWMFGEDEDLKANLRQWIYEKTGSVRLAEIVDKGGLYPLGMDMSGRIGMMSIAPDLTSVTGALGIPADLLIGRPVRAIEKARSGDTLGAVGEALPNFAKNPIIAQSWREKGVRSGRGQQILTPEQIPTHALWYKSLGIQSTAVTNARDYLWAQYRSQTRIDGIKGRYLNRIAQAETEAIRNENPDRQAEIEARIEAVWAEVDAYNRANPERPIRIQPSQIRQRIERNLYGLEALAGKERRDARTDAEMLREVYRIDETLEMDDER